ncbi:MAG: amidase family protein [bacterium]
MNVEEYTRYDALGLAELVSSGEVTAEELSETARRATEAVNNQLNAVVGFVDDRTADTVNENARFKGVPTFLKDLGAGIAGMTQEMGSRLTTGFVPPFTSYLAQRMLDAGFSVIGRTTCPEFGLTLTTESLATGQTKNPWNTAHITGGSSGGSAALVAAGAVPIAHTNDGGGSTRIPASICGNVGLKTSRGLVTLGPTLNDVTGPLIAEGCNSRTVRDTAAFLDAVAGPAAGEGVVTNRPAVSYLEKLNDAPKKYRIALSLDPWGGQPFSAETRAETERIAETLSSLGHQVEEATPDVVKDGAIIASFRTLWFTMAHSNIKKLVPLTKRQPGPDTLEPTTLQMAAAGAELSAFDYASAIGYSNQVSRFLGSFFGHWDLILTPSMTQSTPKLGSAITLLSGGTLDEWFEAAMALVPHTPVANFTGLPAISVPCGIGPGELPLGMHFFAPMGGESELLDIARQLEIAEPWKDRKPVVFAN